MQLSSYLEAKIANWIRGSAMGTPPATLTLALSSADPTDNGSGLAEPADIGYARQAVTLAVPSSTEADGTQTSNTGAVVFTGTDLGVVTHGALYDGVHLLMYGELEVARDVVGDDSVSFAIGYIRIALKEKFGAYLAEAVVNWMRGNAMPTAPTSVKMALSTANPKRDNSTVAEPTDATGYARKAVTFGAPSTTVGVGSTISNSAPVVFGPSVDSNWGAIAYWALYHTVTNDLLAYGPLAVAKTVNIGAGFGFNVGAFTLLVT